MLELFEQGGPVVWVLAGLSIIALAIALFKLMQYVHMGVFGCSVEKALVLWQQGKQQAAKDNLAAIANKALPDMLLTAMDGMTDSNIGEKEARESAARVGADAMERLRSGFRTLEFISTAAPLLGLLGTVLGMIEAFDAMKAAGDQVEVSILSGGISEALLTTAAGLIVAIPTVFFLSFLERRLEHFHHRLQSATTRVFTTSSDTKREQRLAHK